MAQKSSKRCRHEWKHVTERGTNLRGDFCLWLVHKCQKCGLTAEPAGKIMTLKKSKAEA